MVLRLTTAHTKGRTHGVVLTYHAMDPRKWY